jgi:hypothetical protein
VDFDSTARAKAFETRLADTHRGRIVMAETLHREKLGMSGV